MARRFSRIRLLAVGALVVAVLAFILARFTECGSGLGIGVGAPGAPAPNASKQDEPRAGGRSIAVVGSQCTLEEEVHDCDALCRRMMEGGDPGRPIEIDATKGSHGTVERLRACLVEAGATAVEVRSE